METENGASAVRETAPASSTACTPNRWAPYDRRRNVTEVACVVHFITESSSQ
ncbi:MAG: hypothetical protein N2248_03250 [candidate division WOR-3 bacterium]|nr:hypothetical protein [candidate division WOR-3 bacterium]